VEVRDPDARWKRFLTLERFIQTLPKIWLYAQSLEDKDTHPDETLLGGIIALVDSIE
jgi:hypothetical protein